MHANEAQYSPSDRVRHELWGHNKKLKLKASPAGFIHIDKIIRSITSICLVPIVVLKDI